MFGVHYFGQPYFAQANAGGGLITYWVRQIGMRITGGVSALFRLTGAVAGLSRTTKKV